MRRIVFHVALLGVEKSNPTEFKAHGPVINCRSIDRPKVWPIVARDLIFGPRIWLFRKEILKPVISLLKRKGEIYKNFQKIHSETP